jgi:hypothetical protein
MSDLEPLDSVSPGPPAAQPRASEDARLYYWAGFREWSLSWPCDRCGGTTIPLLPGVDARDCDGVIAAAAAHIATQPCPRCLSAYNRAHGGGSQPLAWYDTAVRGWVIRVRRREDSHAIVPLEIRWYDVPRALVHIAAAQVLDACN